MTSSRKSADDIRNAVLRALHQIAPEVDLHTLNPEALLRHELEIDSMDFYRFLVQLHKELNVDIPERDYPKLATLKNCIEYLNSRINPR
jgi:acyl carrier protein